jgi:hypothetical protein
MNIQSGHEPRRRARQVAHQIAEKARRRYQTGGLTGADEDITKSLVPDQIEQQGQAQEQSQELAAPEVASADFSAQPTPGAQTGLTNLVYDTHPDYVSNPTPEEQRAPASQQTQQQVAQTPAQQTGLPPQEGRIGPGGLRYQSPQQINRRFHNPLTDIGRVLVGWQEGTAGLLRAQELERGEYDLENHRQFYDRAYKYGADYDRAMAGLNGEIGLMQGQAQSAINEHQHAPAGGAAAPGAGGQLGTGTAQAPGPGGGNLAMQQVPAQYQARQAQMNALDTATRAAIGNLAVSGDPRTAVAGAGLYQGFMNGELNRAMVAAKLAIWQKAFSQPEEREPSFQQFLPGAGAAPASGAATPAPAPAETREAGAPPAEETGAPPAPSSQQTQAPATVQIAAATPQTAAAVAPTGVRREAGPPIPGAGSPTAGAASPGPQGPTAAEEPPPQRVAQAEPSRGAPPAGPPSPADEEIDPTMRAQGMTAYGYRNWLRAEEQYWNKKATSGRDLLFPQASARDQAMAQSYRDRANRMDELLAAGPKAGAEAAARLQYARPVEVQTDNGPVWMSPAEAMRRQQTGQSDAARMAQTPRNPDVWTPPPGAAGSEPPTKIKKGEEHVQEEAEAARHAFTEVNPKLLQNLHALGLLYREYQSGAGAEQKAAAVAWMKSLGFDKTLKDLSGGKLNIDDWASWKTGDYQAAIKYSANQFLANLHQLPGGQVRNMEMKGIRETLAEPTLNSDASRKILGQMEGLQRYDDKYDRDISDYVENGPLHLFQTGNFDKQWVGRNDTHLQGMVDQAISKYPVMGETLPPVEQRRDGWQYFDTDAGGIKYWNQGKWQVPPQELREVGSPYYLGTKLGTQIWTQHGWMPRTR